MTKPKPEPALYTAGNMESTHDILVPHGAMAQRIPGYAQQDMANVTGEKKHKDMANTRV